MTESVPLKKYLERYIDKPKKKKKKSKSENLNRLRLIDDDTFLPIPNITEIKNKEIDRFNEDLDESDEELNLKIMKKNVGTFKNNSFVTIEDESNQCSSIKSKSLASFKIKEETSSTEEDPLLKKPHLVNNLSLKTSQKNKDSLSLNHKNETKTLQSSHKRKKNKKHLRELNKDISPSKLKSEKYTDSSPPRRKKDISPPRFRSEKYTEDSSPPRRKKDITPPRFRSEKYTEDSSPPRRKKDITPPRFRSEKCTDSSPPRHKRKNLPLRQ